MIYVRNIKGLGSEGLEKSLNEAAKSIGKPVRLVTVDWEREMAVFESKKPSIVRVVDPGEDTLR